jgi:hypothetical protein
MFLIMRVIERQPFRVQRVAEFADFKQACRTVRRAMLKGIELETARIRDGVYFTQYHPTRCNYGRITCDADGYQIAFTPIQGKQHVRG